MNKENKVIAFNKEYKNISEACKEFEISTTLVYNRIDKSGWSLEDALTIPKMVESSPKRQITYNGIIYESKRIL